MSQQKIWQASIHPYHRVIKNNGVLGHYALGADTKAWLIHFESIKNPLASKTRGFTL